MRNPFEFGGLAQNEAFCNRTQELNDLLSSMKNGSNVFMFGERRIGKTSLVYKALSQLSKTKFLTVYVDLWPTDDQASFIAAYAKAQAESFNSKLDNMLDWLRKSMPGLQPTITINEQGQPEISLDLIGRNLPRNTLQAVLQGPAKTAMSRQKQIVVVFDEFQQIFLYKQDQVVRQLRSSIQGHRNVSYIFLGSRKHFIQSILADKNQPLYGSGSYYPLKLIGLQHWLPFIEKKFRQTNKIIEPALIKDLYLQTEGHPFYTQYLCHLLWEITAENSHATEELLVSSIDKLLERQAYEYQTLWESLSSNQHRVLEGLAQESSGVHIFSKQFLYKYGLGQASSTRSALDNLLKKGIIDRENGSYIITNRFFKIWICRLISHIK